MDIKSYKKKNGTTAYKFKAYITVRANTLKKVVLKRKRKLEQHYIVSKKRLIILYLKVK